jgi:divalent metal cation (Fe/Co/Zn/Cd) transporter
MLAEGVHSVADSGNQTLLLFGRRQARRTETSEHPFGFGGERYFYAFLVAVVVFTVGAVFSCYEGIQRIRQPERLTSPAWLPCWSHSRCGTRCARPARAAAAPAG